MASNARTSSTDARDSVPTRSRTAFTFSIAASGSSLRALAITVSTDARCWIGTVLARSISVVSSPGRSRKHLGACKNNRRASYFFCVTTAWSTSASWTSGTCAAARSFPISPVTASRISFLRRPPCTASTSTRDFSWHPSVRPNISRDSGVMTTAWNTRTACARWFASVAVARHAANAAGFDWFCASSDANAAASKSPVLMSSHAAAQHSGELVTSAVSISAVVCLGGESRHASSHSLDSRSISGSVGWEVLSAMRPSISTARRGGRPLTLRSS